MEGKERKRADDLPAGAVEQVREMLHRPRSSADFSPAARATRCSGWQTTPSRNTNSAKKQKPCAATNGAKLWHFPPKRHGRSAPSTICGSS